MRLFEREDYLEKIRGFYHDDGVIKVLTGVRRCGKSCLMQTIAEELRATGVREDHIIYLDLDRYGFRAVKTPDQLEALIEPALKIDGMKYLFIDEIQNVEGFEEVINEFRAEGGFSIFITGSNSYLLSGELAPSGRARPLHPRGRLSQGARLPQDGGQARLRELRYQGDL